MPISQNKYVSITSSQGGKSAASRKDLILRVFTDNELFPTETVLEFTSASSVVNFAGANSQEAKIANAYFGWVSKQTNKAKKISFMRYDKNATKPYLRSTDNVPALAQLKAITDGSVRITMGNSRYCLTELSFADVTSYADVAAVLQAAVNKNTEGGLLWTGATVSFNSSLASFVLEGGENGLNMITFADSCGEGTDISALIGWTQANNAVVSIGTEGSSVIDTLNSSIDISNNFASFAFLGDLDLGDIDEIGNFCQNQNNEYMFVFNVDDSNYSDRIALAGMYNGMCANYMLLPTDLPAFLMPATILAATNYDKVNGTVNYMYQQFPNQPVTVDTDLLAEKLDSLKINYNGQTQKSGTRIEFYQDGYLADGTDIGVFANEIWLKDAMKTAVLNLLIALDKLPANTDGISLLEGTLQEIAAEAKNNGTISAGKDLTNEQKAYITQYTGDETAWQTVYLNGYTLFVELKQEVADGRTKFIAEYTLLYSKGDSIRKVEGTHTLI